MNELLRLWNALPVSILSVQSPMSFFSLLHINQSISQSVNQSNQSINFRLLKASN